MMIPNVPRPPLGDGPRLPRSRRVSRENAAVRALLCIILLTAGVLLPAGPGPVQAQNTQTAPAAAVPPSPAPAAPVGQTAAPGAPAAQPAAAAPPPPPPQPPISLPEVQIPAQNLLTEIDALEKTADRVKYSEEALSHLRLEIEGLVEGASALLESLTPQSEAVRQQIEKLGAPPGKDDPPESQQAAAERQRLNAVAGEIRGAMKTTDVVSERARQLLGRVQGMRQGLFTGELMQRTQSPLSPTTWRQLLTELPWVIRDVYRSLSGFYAMPRQTLFGLAGLLAAVLVFYAALAALVRGFVRSRLVRQLDHPPGFFERAATAGWVAPALAVPAVASLLAMGAGLDGLGLLFGAGDALWTVALYAASVFVAVWALSRAILQPARGLWRLVNLSDLAAKRLHRILTWIAAVYAADLILKELIRILALPISVSIVETFAASMAIGILLIRLVRLPFDPDPRFSPEAMAAPSAEAPPPEASTAQSFYPRVLKALLLLAAISVIGASLLGYIALGRFIAGQIIVTGSVIALVLLVHLAIQALIGADSGVLKPMSTVLVEKAGLDATQSSLLMRAVSVVLDLALALLAIPLVLLTWGYSLPEALSWLKSAVFGFEIGQFRISFARILLAVALFMALLLATRLIQRWINAGLATARFDPGIAHSVYTGVGYAGFAIAALVALSYGGLDITNIAIVAGALSVGIGFGLQSIVNNFVSGLILLVERPVKVGDLVRVGSHEGRVRRIAVRSTELETGDKASVIVPNSELITGAVVNFTHRNVLGRVALKVTASYRSDPEIVRSVLKTVLQECPLILQQPPPGVSFDEFGANGFEFSISAVVTDVGRTGSAKTELRMRIVKAFREAGIEMPFAQHDVHLRDLDMVKSLLSRVAEERARERAEAARPVSPQGDGTKKPA